MEKNVIQAKSKAIQSIISQARRLDGRLSEQQRELGTADLISLLANHDKPSAMIYPDYGPLLDHFKVQLGFHMKEQRDKHQAEKYQFLHNQWHRAATFEGNTALLEWQHTMHTAEELLISLRRDLPQLEYNYESGQIHGTDGVHNQARIFTDVLLYNVTARAALQRETFKNDPALIEHVEYIRSWLKNQIEKLDPKRLILEAAIDFTEEEYLLLQDACGEIRTREQVIMEAMKKTPKRSSYYETLYRSDAHYGVDYRRHSLQHWYAANMVRNMLLRLEHICALVKSLSETEIDFESSNTTTDGMKASITNLY